MEYIKNISRPRDTDLSDIPREPEPTFKPSKTKEAINAMRNKKCGYDFVERLNEREDFWGRMYKGFLLFTALTMFSTYYLFLLLKYFIKINFVNIFRFNILHPLV